MSRAAVALYALSIVLHVGLAMSVSTLKKDEKRAPTAISMKEAPKKKAEPTKIDPPKAEEPKADKSRREPRAKAAPQAAAKADAPPPAAAPKGGGGGDALPDFGLSLGGGTGTGGLAIPGGGSSGGGGDAAAAPAAKPVAKAAQRPADDDCSEAAVKPKPTATPQASYTDRARDAKVEGKVRVEVQVDATGKVTSARIVAGLGHGLDEAALAAAKQWKFAPGTKCGKATTAAFVIGMRFVLGS